MSKTMKIRDYHIIQLKIDNKVVGYCVGEMLSNSLFVHTTQEYLTDAVRHISKMMGHTDEAFVNGFCFGIIEAFLAMPDIDE